MPATTNSVNIHKQEELSIYRTVFLKVRKDQIPGFCELLNLGHHQFWLLLYMR